MKLSTCVFLAVLLCANVYLPQISAYIDSKLLGHLAVPALFFGGSYATAGAGAIIGALVKKQLIGKFGNIGPIGLNVGIGLGGHGHGHGLQLGGGGHVPYPLLHHGGGPEW